MPTYANAYDLLKEVRMGIGEYSEALVNDQLPGTHSNDYIMGEINKAQQLIYALAFERIPGAFIENVDITGVDSVFALPWDFGTLMHFKDDRNRNVERVGIDNLSRTGGSDLLYYRKGQSLVLDKSGVTDTYTLWYRKKPRKIHAGRFSTDGTAQAYLDTKKIARLDDYYNGMKIEIATDNEIDEITDFTASTGIATITGNTSKGDHYGIVSELPEPLQVLIGTKAILNIRATSPTVKAKPTKADFDLYNDLLIASFSAFSDMEEDVDFEEMVSDFAPHVKQWGIVAE